MKGLDLSKFKKHSIDKDKTTLIHPAGHQITIAHKMLSPAMRKQLDAVPQNYAEGGNVEIPSALSPNQPEQQDSLAGLADSTGVPAEVSQNNDSFIPSPIADNIPAPQSVTPGGFNPYEQAQQPKNGMLPQMPNNSNMLQQGLQQTQSGVQNEANAQGALGKEQAGNYAAQAQQAQKLNDDFQNKYQALDSERANLMDDIKNGHIDAKHYVNSMSGGDKTATAIGLILGGMGSGITGGENPVLKHLNNQIDRDIDAQKVGMQNKHNLLSALQQQFGNLRDATSMGKALYADIYANKIAEAASKSANPIAQARAQQAIGELKSKYAPELQQMAARQAVMGGIQQGHVEPEQAVQYLVPKEHQKAVFDEIGRAKNAVHNESAILDSFDKASKENTVMRRVGHLGAEPAALTNTMNLMMPILKDNEGRINETEIEMMRDFMPKAGDTDAKIAEKRSGMQQFIQAKKSAPTAEGYGINLNKIPGYAPQPEGVKKLKTK